jgi:phosphatidylglycerophosphate synthase
VSPNQITVFAFLFSVAGALCFFSPKSFFLAYAFFQINSILDGTDGEVARMNFTFSALGKKLDVYCDYATSALLMIGEFAGYAALDSRSGVVAGSACGIVILIAIVLLWLVAARKCMTPENFDDVEAVCHTRLKRPSTVSERLLSVFLFVSRRDFYILTAFLLSLAGWFAAAHFFLVLVCASWFGLSAFTLRVCAGLKRDRSAAAKPSTAPFPLSRSLES